MERGPDTSACGFQGKFGLYEADPLLCPKCGAQMAIFSFIKDHKVIDKIIRHLKLTFYAERPPPPQVIQQELLMAAVEREEYF